MKKILLLVGILIIAGSIFAIKHYSNDSSLKGHGCCSRHGGVCGCQNGRSLCCDGTQSPSCQCFKDAFPNHINK